MRRCVNAATSAASSTIGPREVFTRYALGFIRPSSRAPIRWRDCSLSTTWIETISAVASSASRVTAATPTSRARASVRLRLQATTDMPNAVASVATLAPTLPRPIRPRVLPVRPAPIPSCQRPARTARSSHTTRRASARIRAKVSSGVASNSASVHDTVTPRAAAVARSIDQLTCPVATRSLRRGSCSSRARGNGVRSRSATMTSTSRRRSIRAARSVR